MGGNRMKHFNMNIALCKDFDESTQSAIGLINEIDLSAQIEKDKIELNIFTLISGFGEDLSEEMEFNYYLICAKDNDYVGKGNNYNKRASYLFSMTMRREKKDIEKEDRSNIPIYPGTFQSMANWKRKVFFPCSGQFEIHVYKNENNTQEQSPVEKLKNYIENRKEPVAIYYFSVKK